MALTKVTGQVINNTTGLVVGVTTVGGGISATDGFFSGIVTAVGNASFSGNVSVGGTLTYEDVTNIDAVGLVTARNGIVVGSGITLSKDGDIFFPGIMTGNATFAGNVDFTGDLSYDEMNARNLNISGIATLGFATAGNAYVAGITTSSLLHVGMGATMIKVEGIPATRVGINSVGPAFTLDVDGDSNVTGTVRQAGLSVVTLASGDATALAIALG